MVAVCIQRQDVLISQPWTEMSQKYGLTNRLPPAVTTTEIGSGFPTL